MVILVDQDNTLNKMWETFVEHASHHCKRHFPFLKADDLDVYNLAETLGIKDPDEQRDLFRAVFTNPNFWLDIPPLDGAVEGMRWLTNHPKVKQLIIVTHPWDGYDECDALKRQWVRRHMPFFDTADMCFTRHKHLLSGGDILIDDAPANLCTFPNDTIRISYPYNYECDSTYTAQNWEDVIRILDRRLR